MQNLSHQGPKQNPARAATHAPVAAHVKRAVALLFDFMQARAAVQKTKARKVSLQLAAIVVFGAALFVWFEVVLFLLLRSAVEPLWAALAALLLNGVTLAGVNLFLLRWNRRQEVPAILSAQEKRQDALAELDSAIERTDMIVQTRVVLPLRRYTMPVAILATFVAGLVVARALFPRENSREWLAFDDDDVRTLI